MRGKRHALTADYLLRHMKPAEKIFDILMRAMYYRSRESYVIEYD